MAYITSAELSTHLYGEVAAEISRGDTTAMATAIAAAMEEAYGYLGIYDTTAIFAATGDQRNPIVVLYIKDIAVWHFIQLANPNVDMQLRETRYKEAIRFFEKVQAGKVNPSLPVPVAPANADGTPGTLENTLMWGSNAKRNNYF